MTKKTIIYIVLFFLAGVTSAQTYEVRIIENDFGYLSYQMRETSGTNTPTTLSDINDMTFVIRYPSGDADIDLICSSNDYNIGDGLGGEQSFGGYDYHYWNAATVPALNPVSDWVQDEWNEICTLKVIGSTGSGLFEIAPDNWDGRSLNWNQTVSGTATDFIPVISGSGVTYSYPTIVYDHVWIGSNVAGHETDWNWSANWTDECGGAGSVPTSSDNIIIPNVTDASGYYPNTNMLGSMEADNMRIAPGAQLSVPSVNGSLDVSGKLFLYGTLFITPGANVTITGDTYIDASECLVIQSDATGTGSFIDNGTIAYGSGGSVKVQTFLINNATAPYFQFHLVGPTINNTGTGVLLDDFNVSGGSTYAYKFDEPTDEWLNFSSPDDPVSTAEGIGLSTNDGNSYTLDMTGELVTGDVYYESLTALGNGNYMLSNPYPSAVFWDDIYPDNTGIVSDMVRVYDETYSGGNYKVYNTTSGGTDDFSGYIQVGQGFFVDALSTNTFSFDNADRHHSTEPFYKLTTYTNRLDVRASGNATTDGILIHFYEGAFLGYNNNEDAEKRMSYNEDATQLWTVCDESINLSINALPLELLADSYSVPTSFICSDTAEYILTFFGTETFETGIDILLEDKLSGGEWVSIDNNTEYIFTASPDDPSNRFVFHFMGPTGFSEISDNGILDIYSFGQYIYVKNLTNDNINKICIYTLSGKSIFETNNVHLTLSKYFMPDQSGYYIVKVLTTNHVYTEKLFLIK